jgi:hypothetical protein
MNLLVVEKKVLNFDNRCKLQSHPTLNLIKNQNFSCCHKLDEVIGLGVTCGTYIFTHFVVKRLECSIDLE